MSVELVIVDEFIELAEIVEKAPISEGKVLEELLGVDPTWLRDSAMSEIVRPAQEDLFR